MTSLLNSSSERERLVLLHLPKVTKLLRKLLESLPSHLPGMWEYDDLLSYGIIGLLKAIDQFDGGQGVVFGRFAKYWIQGEILNVIHGSNWLPCDNSQSEWLGTKRAVRLMDNQELEFERAEIRALLDRALEGLPFRHRKVIELHYQCGVSLKRIGQMLEVHPSRASQLHVEAVEKLRDALTSGCEDKRRLRPRLGNARLLYGRKPGKSTCFEQC